MTDPTQTPRAPLPAQCYRHPGTVAAVTCGSCGRPICPDCMVDAPVGFQCPECARGAGRSAAAYAAPMPQARQPGVRQAPWRVTGTSGVSVTVVLIALNVAVFLATFSNVDGATVDWGLFWRLRLQGGQVAGVGAGEYWRLVSSMFVHGGIAHVAMNMLALYIFGTQMERILGRVWFLALYLTAGLAAGASFILLSPYVPAVGASGAIFGLFGAMLALIIARRHTPEGRAMLQQFIGLLIVNLLFSLMPGIAWQAHLGGFLAGFLLGWVLDHTDNPALRLAPFAALLAATAWVALSGPL